MNFADFPVDSLLHLKFEQIGKIGAMATEPRSPVNVLLADKN